MEQQKPNPTDRHRPGYYEDYNGGKDRHRPGYWAEYYKRKKAAKEQEKAAEREKSDKETKSWIIASVDAELLDNAATKWRDGAEDGHTRALFGCSLDVHYHADTNRTKILGQAFLPKGDAPKPWHNIIATMMLNDEGFSAMMCDAVDLYRKEKELQTT